jgi:ABC-type uncharacterized transport system substrate-binding protein
VKRRAFITLLGGAAVAWPLAANAQQAERVRSIGVLMSIAPDREGQARLAAFLQALQALGWTDGLNVRIETRWGAGNIETIRKFAAELIALGPDVILVSGGTGAGPLLQLTRTVPVVFTQTPDPVGAGFVDSLARPGGNATGFTLSEYGISGKLLEVLKEISPNVTRAAVIRDPAIQQGIGLWSAIQTTAPAFGIEVSPVNMRSAADVEHSMQSFAQLPNGGLIVTGSGLVIVHRELIITQAAKHRLPAVYPLRLFVIEGGLMSYGSDPLDPHRRAAGYVDRILKGEKPADLPVQNPTKYELVINLKTAKTLGLEVPPTLLARADEVIE